MSALDIIIVSFNAANDLERCLLSLQAHPPTGKHEIIVVDNGSSDNNVVRVYEKWPNIQIIPLSNKCNSKYIPIYRLERKK